MKTKNIISNFAEVLTLINQISEYDHDSVRVIIGVLIDVESAKYSMPADEIAEDICATVKAVNAEIGPFVMKS